MNPAMWNINVSTHTMPQKIAATMTKMEKSLIGAKYESIAYIGSQQAHGVNHAVLARQIFEKGNENIVMLIFNEKPKRMRARLVSIQRILDCSKGVSGVKINVETDINAEAMAVWKEATQYRIGAGFKPFALLGTQNKNGMNYYFAVELINISKDKHNEVSLANEVSLVKVNTKTKINKISIANMLMDQNDLPFKYAFSW